MINDMDLKDCEVLELNRRLNEAFKNDKSHVKEMSKNES